MKLLLPLIIALQTFSTGNIVTMKLFQSQKLVFTDSAKEQFSSVCYNEKCVTLNSILNFINENGK